MEFHKRSYEAHSNLELSKNKFQTWKNEDTVDYWRHRRMYELVIPLLEYFKNASWLTLGDGRYGTDAHFIKKYTKNVLATDINDVHLKLAKESGYIDQYQKENAEDLSFGDGTFDFVFCKESYHHFPRPSVALYEMLRVAKIGVILIEPHDQHIIESNHFTRINTLISNFIKFKILNRNRVEEVYESSGNYMYTVSRREFEKVALGLNLPAIVFKGINDFYFPGVENEKVSENGPLFLKTKKELKRGNFRVRIGFSLFNLLCTIFLKVTPKTDLSNSLRDSGYLVKQLPRNPYLG